MTDEQERLIAALDRALASRREWLAANLNATRAHCAAIRARARFEQDVAELEALHQFTTAAAQGLIP